MTDRLFLIDGHALVFKMYYALLRRPMVNSKGVDTSILYGFTKYILELIDRESPTHLAVAFDPPGGTFRNELYPQYKANRDATPQLVIDALEPLKELCAALNIPVIMLGGFEADDVIGTVAKRFASEGMQVYMVTPDKDYGQLVDKDIFQVKPGKNGSPDEVYGEREICEKYGISSTSQIIDLLTICGDSADNVPGVKGVGEVGASKLLTRYGTVEGIYSHLDELSPKQRELFAQARDHIALSKELVTIRTDVPVEVDAQTMRVDRNYGAPLAGLFEEYEFSSLRKYLPEGVAPLSASSSGTIGYETVSPSALLAAARNEGVAAIYSDDAGAGMFTPVGTLFAAVHVGGRNLAATGGAEDFAQLLCDGKVAKAGHSMKLLLDRLASTGSGITVRGRLIDTELLHYLLDPEKNHSLENLCKGILDKELSAGGGSGAGNTDSLFGAYEGDDSPTDEDLASLAVQDGLRKASACAELSGPLLGKVREAGAEGLYDKIEEPLIEVLAKMERSGVRIDLSTLDDYTAALREELVRLEARIREEAGEPTLNISSPRQVGTLLFEKMKLDPKAKKNSSGSYTTDEATLQAIAYKDPIVGDILEYRGVKKLLSTYIEPFAREVSPVTGKVHTTFNQALTATGRLSSSNPNLQNIPIRTERGKEIRKAFVPSDPDGYILSADYSQIELRIMAHLSCDSHLVGAFRNGEDIHRATAAKIFDIPSSEVTAEQRRIAKTANFGIMYGISAFGLAQRLQIPRYEAKQIIDDYFESFPAISSYIADTLDSARECGYVETIFGRRRYLPDINARNATVRSLAERNAINAPIQGTAADIIKLAMIRVDEALKENKLRSRMVLQIHDELVFDAREDEIPVLQKIVVESMEGVADLTVPLTVDCRYGKNWLEAH